MNIGSAVFTATKKLKSSSSTPSLDADVILSYLLHQPREFIYSHPEHELNKKQEKNFLLLINRRKKLEPIAYIIGQKEFFSLPFYVDKNVLIPRPDTESLVEKVLNFIARQETRSLGKLAKSPSLRTRADITIIDIGTGSGCIAISLKKYLPRVNIIASDISKKALKIATKNAKKNQVKIKFYESDLFSNIPKKYMGKIDIIVANLPYLPKNVAQKKNLKYEPNIALQDKKYLPKFLQQAKKYLSPQGRIFLETNKRMAKIINKSRLNCDSLFF